MFISEQVNSDSISSSLNPVNPDEALQNLEEFFALKLDQYSENGSMSSDEKLDKIPVYTIKYARTLGLSYEQIKPLLKIILDNQGLNPDINYDDFFNKIKQESINNTANTKDIQTFTVDDKKIFTNNRMIKLARISNLSDFVKWIADCNESIRKDMNISQGRILLLNSKNKIIAGLLNLNETDRDLLQINDLFENIVKKTPVPKSLMKGVLDEINKNKQDKTFSEAISSYYATKEFKSTEKMKGIDAIKRQIIQKTVFKKTKVVAQPIKTNINKLKHNNVLPSSKITVGSWTQGESKKTDLARKLPFSIDNILASKKNDTTKRSGGSSFHY